MTTPAEIREWGIQNGLAKPGRGRLSKELRDAYAKAMGQSVDSPADSKQHDDGPPYSYDVPLPLDVVEPEEDTGGIAGLPPLPTQRVRDEDLLYTICEQTGAIVGTDRCGTCRNRVACCACVNGPSGPGWLKHSSPAEVYLVVSTS